jgi:hypothetical protein
VPEESVWTLVLADNRTLAVQPVCRRYIQLVWLLVVEARCDQSLRKLQTFIFNLGWEPKSHIRDLVGRTRILFHSVACSRCDEPSDIGWDADKSLAFPMSSTFILTVLLSHQSLLFCICQTFTFIIVSLIM